MKIEESRLTEALAEQGPADPSAGLVDRIMDGLPAEAESEGWIERFVPVAWPVALVSAAAAVVVGVVGLRPSEAVTDPVAAITQTQPEVRGLIEVPE